MLINKQFYPLLIYLDQPTQKQVATIFVDSLLEAKSPLDSVEVLKNFFTLISPLLVSGGTSAQGTTDSPILQKNLAKLVLLISNASPAAELELLKTATDAVLKLDGSDAKLTLALKALQLAEKNLRHTGGAPKSDDMEQTGGVFKRLFQLIHKIVQAFVLDSPEIALRLYMHASVVTAKIANGLPDLREDLQTICSEFFIQSIVTFEDHISDSNKQFNSLQIMINCLASKDSKSISSCISDEDYQRIASKLTTHSAKLLRIPQQIKSVLAASQLHWNVPSKRNGALVAQQIQKCIKMADTTLHTISGTQQLSLFLQVLQSCINYRKAGAEDITSAFILRLVDLCEETSLTCTTTEEDVHNFDILKLLKAKALEITSAKESSS
eukprot:Filipodium_phascolosomae@DN4625_c0_g1_i1.p1